MNSINKVILIGNVCRDPKVQEFDEGGKMARFSIATNQRAFTKNGREFPEKTEFHRIAVYNSSQVDFTRKYINKGAGVYVEGEIHTRQYEDKNGTRHYITEIYAKQITVLAYPKNNSENQIADDEYDIPSDVDENLPF